MQLTDLRDIAASPAVVRAALVRPAVLQRCVRGREASAGSPVTGRETTVVRKVGPMQALHRGDHAVRPDRGAMSDQRHRNRTELAGRKDDDKKKGWSRRLIG